MYQNKKSKKLQQQKKRKTRKGQKDHETRLSGLIFRFGLKIGMITQNSRFKDI